MGEGGHCGFCDADVRSDRDGDDDGGEGGARREESLHSLHHGAREDGHHDRLLVGQESGLVWRRSH